MAQIFVKTRHTSKIPTGVSGAIRRGQFCSYNAVFAKIWRHFTELLLQIPGLLALSIFIFTGVGFCEEADFPNYAGYVNDYSNILSGETKDKLTALLAEIESKTTSQLAVLTIDTTAPLYIET